MAAFLQCWCSSPSLRTLSIHLSLGLHRGHVPPTFIVILLLHLQHSCRVSLHAWSYNERRFWVTLQNTRFVLSASACFPFQLLEYFILDTDLTPVPIHEFIIRFGASQRELGAELVQDNVPIAFASKSFTETLSRL